MNARNAARSRTRSGVTTTASGPNRHPALPAKGSSVIASRNGRARRRSCRSRSRTQGGQTVVRWDASALHHRVEIRLVTYAAPLPRRFQKAAKQLLKLWGVVEAREAGFVELHQDLWLVLRPAPPPPSSPLLACCLQVHRREVCSAHGRVQRREQRIPDRAQSRRVAHVEGQDEMQRLTVTDLPAVTPPQAHALNVAARWQACNRLGRGARQAPGAVSQSGATGKR
jgi:hypothetical protein